MNILSHTNKKSFFSIGKKLLYNRQLINFTCYVKIHNLENKENEENIIEKINKDPQKFLDYSQTQEICNETFEREPYYFRYFDNRFKTFQMCMKAISKNVDNFDYVPLENFNKNLRENLIFGALNKDFRKIMSINEKFLTRDICYTAIVKYYDEYKTKICLGNGISPPKFEDGGILKPILEFIPYYLITKEMCLTAIKVNDINFAYMPYEFLDDYTFCLNILAINQNYLDYFPKNNKDQLMCFKAVKKNSNALNFVPKNILLDDFGNKIINEAAKYDLMKTFEILVEKFNFFGVSAICCNDGIYIKNIETHPNLSNLTKFKVFYNGLYKSLFYPNIRFNNLCRIYNDFYNGKYRIKPVKLEVVYYYGFFKITKTFFYESK